MMKKLAVSFFVTILLSTTIFSQTSIFADVAAPREQMEHGITADQIICKEGYVNVIKKSNNKPLCVKPSTAEQLSGNGIVTISATQLILDDAKNYDSSKPIGTVKKLALVKVPASMTKFSSNPAAAAYNVAFDLCANDAAILAPEITVESDTESKYVKLVGTISSNSCQTSTVQIKASNTDTIKFELLNKGGISKKLIGLEEKVTDLQSELEQVKSGLATRLKDSEQNTELIQSDSERIADIIRIRTELNQARDELNRYMFALNVVPKFEPKDLEIKKSFTNSTIEGIVVNMLAATPAIQQKNVFDVAFEICSDKMGLRVPIVIVSSDTESKAIKLGDRIAPNSCQVSGTKILANLENSITVTAEETVEKSNTASDLDKQITELEKIIQEEKNNLKSLTHNPKRPDDFDKQFIDLTEKIREHRAQILELKAKLYKYLTLG